MGESRSIITDNRRIRAAGIHEVVKGDLDDSDNYLFWIQNDGGVYRLFFMKPGSGGDPRAVLLRRWPLASGISGRAKHMLTDAQWQAIRKLARVVPKGWLP